MFSSFSGAIYSPYANLNMFFALSIILMLPLGNTIPTSPVQSHSPSKASLVFSGFLKYPLNIVGPLNYTSPLGGLSVDKYPISGTSLSLAFKVGATPPTWPNVGSSG